MCTQQEAPGTSGKNIPQCGLTSLESCHEGGWVLGGWTFWLLQNHIASSRLSSTLACCVTLSKFLSLSGPEFPLLEDGWRYTYLTAACENDVEGG